MNSWVFLLTLISMEVSGILGFFLSIWYLITVWKGTKRQLVNVQKKSKKVVILALKLIGSLVSILFFFCFIFLVIGKPDAGNVYALKGSLEYQQFLFREYFNGLFQPVFVFIVLFFLAVNLFFIQLISRSTEHKNTWDSNQPFIFYLRSFSTDKQTKKSLTRFLVPIQTEEEALVSVLDDIAPVIAIGDPSDEFCPHGAVRIYLRNEEWKEKVIEFATKSKFVVLRLGETQNFKWEMNWCFEHIDPKKLLFIIPLSKTSRVLQNLIEELQEDGVQISALSINPTKKIRGTITGFLYFDENNQAAFSALQNNRLIMSFANYDDLLREKLEPFLTRFGKIKKARFIKLRSILVFCSILIILISSILSINLATQYSNFPEDLGKMAADSEVLTSAYNSTDYKTLSLQIFRSEAKGLDLIGQTKKNEVIALESKLKNELSNWENDKINGEKEYSDEYYLDWLILCKQHLSETDYQLYVRDLIAVAEAAVQ